MRINGNHYGSFEEGINLLKEVQGQMTVEVSIPVPSIKPLSVTTNSVNNAKRQHNDKDDVEPLPPRKKPVIRSLPDWASEAKTAKAEGKPLLIIPQDKEIVVHEIHKCRKDGCNKQSTCSEGYFNEHQNRTQRAFELEECLSFGNERRVLSLLL